MFGNVDYSLCACALRYINVEVARGRDVELVEWRVEEYVFFFLNF